MHTPSKKPLPRSKKVANSAIIGAAAAVVLALGAATVQGQQVQANNAEAAEIYTPAPTPDRVVIIGDSYTAGSEEGGTDESNWTHQIRPAVREKGNPVDYRVSGLGGSGYLAEGPSGKTFLDAVKQTVTPGTDVVVIFGSLNDRAHAGEVAAAAREVYEYVEATAPDAQLVVVGPPIPYDEPTSEDAEISSEVRAAADGTADAYVDPIAGDWFDNEDIIGEDGVHPTDEGHKLMAERIAPTLRNALEASRRAG